MEVLEGDLGRVEECVDSLHFSATGLHNFETLITQGSTRSISFYANTH